MKRRERFEDFGVVAQVKRALRPSARTATVLGFLLGGFVPLASWVVAHREYETTIGLWQLSTLLVLGGLIYSARTVYVWGTLAFSSPLKAVGWTLLLEGVMVLSRTGWLSFSALIYLIMINGTATACSLTVKKAAL